VPLRVHCVRRARAASSWSWSRTNRAHPSDPCGRQNHAWSGHAIPADLCDDASGEFARLAGRHWGHGTRRWRHRPVQVVADRWPPGVARKLGWASRLLGHTSDVRSQGTSARQRRRAPYGDRRAVVARSGRCMGNGRAAVRRLRRGWGCAVRRGAQSSVMDEPGEGLSCTGTSGTGALPCGRGHGTADLHQSQIPQKRLVGAGSVLEARPASPGPWGRKRRAGEGGGASYNPAPPITAGCQRVRHGWPLALAGVVSPQVPGMPGRKPLCRAVRMNLEGSYKVVRIRCRRDSPQSSRTYAQSTRWILSMPGAALCRRCDAMRWAGSGGRRTATNTAEHPWLIRRIRGACRHLLKRKPKYLVVMERRCSNYPCTSVRTSAKYGCAAG